MDEDDNEPKRRADLPWLYYPRANSVRVLNPHRVPSFAEIIIDNGDAGSEVTGGAWGWSTLPVFYGVDSRYGQIAYRPNKYRFTPPSIPAGRYEIYLWWVEHENRSTAVKIDVSHDGGVAQITVDQTGNGGGWNLLGDYDLSSGAYVEIIDDAPTFLNGMFASADAVRFRRVAQ